MESASIEGQKNVFVFVDHQTNIPKTYKKTNEEKNLAYGRETLTLLAFADISTNTEIT